MKNILNLANYGTAVSFSVMLEQITPLVIPVAVAVIVEALKLGFDYLKHQRRKYKNNEAN